MKVLGTGLIGRAFSVATQPHVSATIFAKGVADSSCTDPRQLQRELTELRDTLAAWQKQDGTFIYVSSGGAVYGQTEAVRHEDMTPAPVSVYGRHKLDCELVVVGSGVPYLILRMPNVVGTGGNPRQLIPSLVHQALEGHVTLSLGASRDIIDIEDVVHLTLAMIRNGAENETVNVVSGISTDIGDIFSYIEKMLGRTVDIAWQPGGRKQQFSVEKLAQLASQRLPFETGYAEAVIRKYLVSRKVAMPLYEF